MNVTVLGMNGPFPAAEGACSGYLVCGGDSRIVMDLGCGTLPLLTRLTAPETLTALVLTHWHSDHCSDVLPLLYRLESARAQGVPPLNLYAPVDEASPVRQAVLACPAVVLHDLRPGDCVSVGDVTVAAFHANHPVPALMLRLTSEGRSLCYTGDTNEVDGLTEFARDADLLLADGLFPAEVWRDNKPHLSAERAARLSVQAGAKRLLITHLNPMIDPAGLLREARAVRIDAALAERGRTYPV